MAVGGGGWGVVGGGDDLVAAVAGVAIVVDVGVKVVDVAAVAGDGEFTLDPV